MGNGLGRGPIIVGALAIAIIGAALAVSREPTDDGIASSSPSTAASPSIGATPRATLPAVTSTGPSVAPTPSPTGIVARRIRIERLEIDLRIIEGDGIDAPINKVAHYPGTGWPGGGTNIYIYGHAQKGMFLALWDIKVDDQVVLDLEDGTSRTYVVTVVKPRVPWNALEYLASTPAEQLTLQTSTSYTATAPRFVAIAVPAS